MASKEQGGRVQPVSTPSKPSKPASSAKLGSTFGPSPNSASRGKNQK